MFVLRVYGNSHPALVIHSAADLDYYYCYIILLLYFTSIIIIYTVITRI